MKKITFFIIIVFAFATCTKERQPLVVFKKYDETEALKNQQKHQNPRMRFQLFQSKVTDLNTVFKPFEDDLAYFSEEDYQSLKPLILEKDIPTLQQTIKEGKLTYEKLTLFYLYRIRKFESDSTLSLNAIISLNPYVVKQAKARDKMAKNVNVNSIYGMPILLKDNINTANMPTTAGAFVLKENQTADNAYIVKKLIENNALILGKVNLSEWAYFFCSGCPLGYSAVGGQTLNPYGRSQFETGGSSSGSGVSVAANYAVAAIGTETSGSITSPSSQNSVVGLKPTIGVLSRSGIVPISSTLDTPGPMTKSVIDNAILMNALLGYDQDDTASVNIVENYFGDFSKPITDFKLGVLKSLMSESIYKNTIQKLKDKGVTIVELNPENMDYNGFITILNIDMKNDLPSYLSKYTSSNIAVKNIEDIIKFNLQDSIVRAPYGQQLFEGITKDTTTNEELEAIKERLNFAGKTYFAGLIEENVDAILSINNYHSGVAAVSKHPTLTVPMGYKKTGEPISLTFIGKPFSEKKLLQIGYAFEQVTNARKTPKNYK